jgi:hypothetical protein
MHTVTHDMNNWDQWCAQLGQTTYYPKTDAVILSPSFSTFLSFSATSTIIYLDILEFWWLP